MSVIQADTETLLKRSTSRCPRCKAQVPAEIVQRGDQVWMNKRCPQHGDFSVRIAADARFYHLSHGAASSGGGCCGSSCGCGLSVTGLTLNAATQDPFETLSTCIALIEIVDSCNLTCPTCYAASPWGVGEHVKHLPFDQFKQRIGGVLQRKGFIDILQLSGGEPTIHPEFFDVLQWSIEQKQIGYVLVNTNAVRIATDGAFLQRLAELRKRPNSFELYVQFDGPQADGQQELRGADLREIRRKAIDLAGERGVPTTLAMVVTPATLPYIGDTLRFGLDRPHVRGITYQPMFLSGRIPPADSRDNGHAGSNGGAIALTVAGQSHAPVPISVGDVILNLVAQSRGALTVEDFTPLPCGDPNCHTISYLLRSASGTIGLSRLVDLKTVQGFLSNRVDYRIEDLAQCGCDSEPLGSLIKSLEISPEQPFRVFIKPFMDAWTFDQDRIDRCCTHVIRPDGKLDSFCRYYLDGPAANVG